MNVIISTKKNKSIRFYNDFHNLRIWSSLRVPCNTNSTDWCNKKMQFSKGSFNEKSEVSSYEIKYDYPFIKKLICKTGQSDNQVIFSIPELGYTSTYLKSDFTDVSKLSIHGLCLPVNPNVASSLEAYFAIKEIKININDIIRE